MKKIKWLILILILVIVILAIMIGILNNTTGNSEENTNEIGEEGLVVDYENVNIEKVKNSMDFYTVSNSIKKYLENTPGSNLFLALEMNILTQANVDVYAVYGMEYTNENTYVKDVYYIVTLDKNNRTFEVEKLVDNRYSDIDEIPLINNNDAVIQANSYNSYTDEMTTHQYICQQYLESYKILASIKPDKLYELIDEEYKTEKFGTLQNFESYIRRNREEIQNVTLEKYKVNTYDTYLQYICVDQNNEYYIFNETSVMDYKLILDTYTVDLPEFTDRYNVSNEQSKVGMNIQKVIDAINGGDYNYVYKKLDSTFKQNNFPTLESFEEYITHNFYENNNVTYLSYEKSGNLHIYEISLTNAEEENSTTITKSIIMQLLDGTGFVMSFNVE